MKHFDSFPLRALVVLTLASVLVASAATAQPLPKHPNDLKYGELDFDIPRAEQYRHTLSNGSVAYVVEDKTLPLFTVGVRVRVGSFLEPADKVGLAALTGSMMRLGGAGDLDGGAFDERAAFLAANISSSIGTTSGRASVNCLSSQQAECLDLFFSMMREPAFDEVRLATEKTNRLERLKQRNDEASSIARREWQWLMYGKEHFSSRNVTGASLASITTSDLAEFHNSYWRPKSMIWTVSGDVDTQAVLKALDERLAGWTNEGAKDVPWPPPVPRNVPVPGVYVAQKEIPQGRVQIGSLTAQRKDWMAKDEMATDLMNEILGGGGFTSRITKRIRSDEGLAYSAGSQFGLSNYWAGQFAVFYQSKSETVAFAAEIAYEELERIRTSKVSDGELTTAKGAFRDSFPGNFESAASIAGLFAQDEYLGRPHEYWYTYQKRVDEVSADDILRAAKKYLKPEEMVFLVVGDWAEVEKGDADGRATMGQFFGGNANMLPERDPVTLEPVP